MSSFACDLWANHDILLWTEAVLNINLWVKITRKKKQQYVRPGCNHECMDGCSIIILCVLNEPSHFDDARFGPRSGPIGSMHLKKFSGWRDSF